MSHNLNWLLFTDVSGQPVSTIFKGQAAKTMEPINCPETSANNDQYTKRNILEERRSYSIMFQFFFSITYTIIYVFTE